MKLSNKLLKTMAEIRPEPALNDGLDGEKMQEIMTKIYLFIIVLGVVAGILNNLGYFWLRRKKNENANK